MAQRKPLKTLRIGMIGAGFIARFHLESFTGVRNCAITGVYSPTKESRTALAKRADELGLGPCTAHASLDKLIQAKDVDALWILSPNDTRVATMQAIHKAVKGGKRLRGIACEKPLARNLAEARAMVSLADDARLATGYLENQVFSTAVERGKEIIWRRAVPLTGRPYLARAAEEHSGPHMPWFWQGEKQGGGVLSDMMCHSVEVARHMLTAPDEARDALTVKSVNATVANLKWTRPAYVRRLKREMGREVDYGRRPAEDFARGTLVLEDPDGNEAMIETTTSWAYVGAGLRIQLGAAGAGVFDGVLLPRHRAQGLHLARGQGRRRRGPGGEAECGAGPDAGAGGRGRGLRLHQREPPHGGVLPHRRDAFRDLS